MKKLHNIVKQLSHEEAIVSFNVFITYCFTRVTMKTKFNIQPEFYSIFRDYQGGGGPLSLDSLRSVVEKQRFKSKLSFVMVGSICLIFSLKKSWRGRELHNVNSSLSLVHQHRFVLLYVKELSVKIQSRFYFITLLS